MRLLNRCIRVLATEIFGKISVASTRTHGHGEETLLSSGWTLIGSELSSPNVNSLVRAEWSFPIRYLNIIIKPLCGNLDICLNFRWQNSVRVLSVADRDWKWKILFWNALFGRTLAQFSRFRDRNPFQWRRPRACECAYYHESCSEKFPQTTLSD